MAHESELYATPRSVTNLDDCYFYHTMDLPGYGTVTGDWDLRGRESVYLANTKFRGMRVLDVGAASGLLTFYAEKCGATVTSYDLSEDFSWDVVPLHAANYKAFATSNKETIRRCNNGYWLAHAALGSTARMVHGSIYDVPRAIGPVDVAIVGSLLEHLRDPFLALQNVLRLTKGTVVIADLLPRQSVARRILTRLRVPFEALDFLRSPYATFVPHHGRPLQGVWWLLSPSLVAEMVRVLGFEDVEITYHWQRYAHRTWRLYTVKANRTRDHYDY